MQKKFIDTENYIRLLEGFERLENLPADAPTIGLAYGSFGLGKTMSLERIAAQKDNVVLLRALQTWSKVSVLKTLCDEFGLDTKGHTSTLYERVRDELLSDERVLVVDEVDTLLMGTKKEVFELFRDLHDETGMTLFYIGMEEADAKFKRHQHYYSRIAVFVKFQPIGVNDIEKFCALSDVHIQADLIHYFSQKWPNMRQILVMLHGLESYCLMNDIVNVDLKIFKQSGVERGAKTTAK